MKTLAVIAACYAGCFSFAFVLAGIADLVSYDQLHPKLNDPDREVESRHPGILGLLGIIVCVFAEIVLQGALSVIFSIVINWPKKPEARKNIYIGAILSVITLAAIHLSR